MKLLLAFLLAAIPALGQSTTCTGALTAGVGAIQCVGVQTCPPPQPATVTQPCPPGQTGAITTAFVCNGSTWTPTTVNSCVGSPPPSGVQIVPAPPVGGSPPVFHANPGTIYAFALPISQGSVAITIAPGSPDFSLKVALSAVAGDFVTAAAMPLTQTVGFGIPPNKIVYPYYALQGSESAGLGWVTIDQGRGVAVVSHGWYFSFQSQASVPVSFYMQIPQQ